MPTKGGEEKKSLLEKTESVTSIKLEEKTQHQGPNRRKAVTKTTRFANPRVDSEHKEVLSFTTTGDKKVSRASSSKTSGGIAGNDAKGRPKRTPVANNSKAVSGTAKNDIKKLNKATSAADNSKPTGGATGNNDKERSKKLSEVTDSKTTEEPFRRSSRKSSKKESEERSSETTSKIAGDDLVKFSEETSRESSPKTTSEIAAGEDVSIEISETSSSDKTSETAEDIEDCPTEISPEDDTGKGKSKKRSLHRQESHPGFKNKRDDKLTLKDAIPVLPRRIAIACLVINCILPGGGKYYHLLY